MEESKHEFKYVLMEEFFSKKDGVVYHNFRLNGREWMVESTAWKDIPWVEIPHPGEDVSGKE